MEDAVRDTKIVAIGNQKGGVGKSTLAVHLARGLAERGRKSLIVDLDENAGTTHHFGIDGDAFYGTFELMLGAEDAEVVTMTNDPVDGVWLPEHVDIIPCNRKISNIDTALRDHAKMRNPHEALSEPLRALHGKYDYIFLDTAPNSNTPTVAAYKAAEYFLLAAIPDPFSIRGLNDALADIDDAQKHGNQNLILLGVVLLAVRERTRLAQELLDYVEKTFTPEGGVSRKFNTMIGHSTVLPAAQKLGKTIFETEPEHKITEQFRELVKEFEVRIGELSRPREEALNA
ncbi:MAG: ParA family protein [Candidatus Eisenbacteria bacterium]